jgi:hypothetical protein
MIILLFLLLGVYGAFEVFVGIRLIVWGLIRLGMMLIGREP